MSTLANDLRKLVNNKRFSDLRLECADGSVYAYGGILAARSTEFDRLLLEDAAEPSEAEDLGSENVLLLIDVQTNAMLVALEFIYTAELQPNSLTRDLIVEVYYCGIRFGLTLLQEMVIDFAIKSLQDEDANFAAELLSESVQRKEALASTRLFELLCKYLGRMQLHHISFESLSSDALKILLETTQHLKDQYFASTEYSVLRYIILHSATKVSEAAFLLFEMQLPLYPPSSQSDIDPVELPLELHQLYQPVAEAVAQYVHAVDLARIDGFMLVHLERLQVISRATLIKGFRHHAIYRAPLPPHRGKGNTFAWSEEDRGRQVVVNGNLVNSTAPSGWQNIRGRDPFTGFGPYEWEVAFENGGNDNFGIGVCAANVSEPTQFLGFDSNAWIFYSGGLIYHNRQHQSYAASYKKGDVVRVHLDMGKRTLGFSVNGVKYDAAYTGLPDRLYPAISLKQSSARVYRV